MPHEAMLITTVVMGLVLASGLGFLAHRLRLPPLVGYLLAGILVGPFTPGFIGDTNLAGQLAEIGVILLMFGVGLHFSVEDLAAVRKIAVPGALAQILVRRGLGAPEAARAWLAADERHDPRAFAGIDDAVAVVLGHVAEHVAVLLGHAGRADAKRAEALHR